MDSIAEKSSYDADVQAFEEAKGSGTVGIPRYSKWASGEGTLLIVLCHFNYDWSTGVPVPRMIQVLDVDKGWPFDIEVAQFKQYIRKRIYTPIYTPIDL